MEKSNYYKVWAYLQKQDVAFFTYSENIQNLLIAFFLVCIANKLCSILCELKK